jgi:hypothetical protein
VQVGRYQVLETLGTGASSRVVRGYDSLIDRAVAIKLFSPELARGESRTNSLGKRGGWATDAPVITWRCMTWGSRVDVHASVMNWWKGNP